MTEIDKTIAEVMENNDLDKEAAERVVEIMEELDIDEEDSVEIEEMGL